MKPKIAILLLCSLVLLTIPGLAFQNEPEGFRVLKWGDPPTEDMFFVKTVDDIKGYFRKDDKMNIGDAKRRIVVYQFYDDPERFTSGVMLFDKEENYDILKDIL